ncbi:hypothetical protein HDF15_004657 [Granulicella mallensis]|uniref:Uncharacterized protein n=1 Tax=Granulicella mallensis TaxID=940614 RepID=A0A7W7ZW03_9BACT|nr:hypothetical protein [Granulicella mallensis]
MQTGIGNQNVDGSELRDDIAEHRDYLVLFADVCAKSNRGATVALDFADYLFRWRGDIRMIDNDSRTCICECNGNGCADTRTRPGYDRDLSF